MGTNDTPFVPFPSPPADPTQSVAEQDLHGIDRDDEHERAMLYVAEQKAIATKMREHLLKLNGNVEARKNLHRKTVARTTSAPPYLESP